MAKLIFTDKNFSGQVYELSLEKTTVGRSDQNTLVIHDNSLSATHCEILYNGPEVIVRDLGSSNGTFVDGARLNNQQSQLKSGQVVRFGTVEARLELAEADDYSGDTDITAIYAHSRAIRDARRAQRKQPADPSKQLDADPLPETDNQTVLLPNPDRVKPAFDPGTVEKTEQPAGSSKGKFVLIALVVLGVVILIWWLVTGKK